MYVINEAIIIILLLFIFQVNISESEIKIFHERMHGVFLSTIVTLLQILDTSKQ